MSGTFFSGYEKSKYDSVVKSTQKGRGREERQNRSQLHAHTKRLRKTHKKYNKLCHQIIIKSTFNITRGRYVQGKLLCHSFR